MSLEVKNSTPTTLVVERIFCLIAFIGTYLITGNYLGIQNSFPLCRSSNPFIRALGILVFDIVYFFAVVFVMLALCPVLTLIYNNIFEIFSTFMVVFLA